MADAEKDDLPEVVERLNVALVKDAALALRRLVERTGKKKVDLANRALQLYDFVDQELRQGNEVLVRAPDGTIQRLRIM